jgi:hypothetical protein
MLLDAVATLHRLWKLVELSCRLHLLLWPPLLLDCSGGRLTFHGGLFVGGEKKSVKDSLAPIADPMVSIADPSIHPDDLFYSDAFCTENALPPADADGFHDAVEHHGPPSNVTNADAGASPSALEPSG